MSSVSSSNHLDKRVPALRFPGFVGEWSIAKLGEIGTFTKGAPLSKADISNNGTPFILYGELYTTYREVAYDIKRKTDKIVPEIYYSRIGDVIIPTSGETPEEIATATCVMIPGVILAGDLNIYRTNIVDGRIISFIINHVVNDKIAKVAQGKSVVHVKSGDLSKIVVNYPNTTEQKKILLFLELLDQRIAKQRELVESLKRYKRGVLKCLFNSISQFKKLYEISEYITSDLSLENIKNNKAGDFPVYDASGISTYIDNFKMLNDYIAIIKDGSGVGRLQYCKEKSSFIGTLGGVIAKDCNTKYLYAAMQFIDFREFIIGATIPHVYYKDYGKVKIPFPDKNMQFKIESISDLLERKINIAELNLKKFTALKTALLQQMFI